MAVLTRWLRAGCTNDLVQDAALRAASTLDAAQAEPATTPHFCISLEGVWEAGDLYTGATSWLVHRAVVKCSRGAVQAPS